MQRVPQESQSYGGWYYFAKLLASDRVMCWTCQMATATEQHHEWIERVLQVARPVDPMIAFSKRLAAITERITRVRGPGSTAGEDAKLKASEAGVFARKAAASAKGRDFAPAYALLNNAARLLGMSEVAAPVTPPPPREKAPTEGSGEPPPPPPRETAPTHPSGQPPPPPPLPGTGPARQAPVQATGPVSPAVAFTQSRLLWDTTRKQVQVELQKLEATILQETAEEPDAATIAANSKILYTILDFLDERLIDKLDDALNAKTPEDRSKLQTEARDIIDEYIDYMSSDELLHDIDDNGFVDMQIQATVSGQLNAIGSNLKALGA